MRYILTNIFLIVLTVGLLLGSCLFAYLRSEQLVVAYEEDIEPQAFTETASPDRDDWLAFGKKTYRANCQNCHTADGSGRSMYPPVQNMAAHLAAPGGRDYLVDLILYGLYTSTYGAPMPPMPELSDTEIAAVNNYMLVRFAAAGQAPGKEAFYGPKEVAARRGRAVSEWGVADTRPDIPTARELGRGVQVSVSGEDSAVPGGTDE